jgi:hypothetical protein
LEKKVEAFVTAGMPLFDKDGRRVYLYRVSEYEGSVFLASYNNVSEEDIEKEIQSAHRLWEEYVREEEIAQYGKPINDISDDEWDRIKDNELSGEQVEMLSKKYPFELWNWEQRVCMKFQMWYLDADVEASGTQHRCGGCMGD